jgi:hypothetical protein
MPRIAATFRLGGHTLVGVGWPLTTVPESLSWVVWIGIIWPICEGLYAAITTEYHVFAALF